jgi:hypothetical protein
MNQTSNTSTSSSSYYAQARGGAIWSGSDASVSITRCDFTSNQASSSSYGMYYGGANASSRGGAVFLGGNGQTNITNCSFSQNSAYSLPRSSAFVAAWVAAEANRIAAASSR